MNKAFDRNQKLGVMIVGLGGAVATTAVAGTELLKIGAIGREGLPLAEAPQNLVGELANYEQIVFGGWDLSGDDLAQAAATHNVLTLQQFQSVSQVLSQIKPLPAVGSVDFCANIACDHVTIAENHREAIEILRENIRDFKIANECDTVVIINLASTEKYFDKSAATFATLKYLEQALDANARDIPPALLYAYAAIAEAAPYGNFTPSTAADVPAMVEFAKQKGVPVAGKDGKTGQTMMKTVIAPGLKSRALKIEGWFSTNILGNRDGLALSDPDSLKSKVKTKGSVLDDMLGYVVEDHIVDIRYYKPRGDNKEAWDNIDITGFLGQPMQIKVNFLCKDSILAAPLAIEIARCLDLAKRRGEGGVCEALSVFFKLPQVDNEATTKPIHALHEQERMLFDWLGQTAPTASPTNGHEIVNGNGQNGGSTNGNSHVAEVIASVAASENGLLS